ncbi:MAG: hypothetical protein NTY38_17590, partial [Acidobacteria bacterium]|nr:hypothetical protein [Acidobacteriota bacterium]
MRVILRAFGVAVLSLAALGAAQSPELDKARQEVERIRGLVAAGAAPRARLDAAWATLDDARDDAVLRSTLFGRVTAQDLSEEQSRNMLNAAQRRLDRQMARVEKAREMIAAGVTASVSMAPFLAELDLRQKTLDLAGSRARLFAEIVEQARAEQAALPLPDQPTDSPGSVVVRYDGAG